MKFNITRDDVLRSKALPQEWYEVEVTGVEEKQSKAGDSINTIIEFTVISGQFINAKFFRLFSEKAPGFVIPYLEALGVEVGEEGGEFDLHATKGRRLKVFNKPQMYEGQIRNNIEGFAAL